MLVNDEAQHCPCGSNTVYSDCCAPFVSGVRPAPTAEALMRSRYTAFAIGAVDYLIDTLDPDRRGENDHELLSEQIRETEWHKLEIVSTQMGQPGDLTGQVEFKAHFSSPDLAGYLHETSNFRHEENHWYYVDGNVEFYPES